MDMQIAQAVAAALDEHVASIRRSGATPSLMALVDQARPFDTGDAELGWQIHISATIVAEDS